MIRSCCSHGPSVAISSWEANGRWDPEALVAASREQGVSALAWSALREAVSEEARQARNLLHAGARSSAARELLVRLELERVLDSLAGAGVQTLVIKGAALAYEVYPLPWLRPRTDTDLLIRFDDLAGASRLLEANGYLRSSALTSGVLVSHQVAFERIDTHGVHHVIDLHWKIVNPQILADALSFGELWAGRHHVPALGPSASVPSLVASSVLSCIHRLAHHQGQDRLIWLDHLRLLCGRFEPADWDTLEQIARERHVAGLCLSGLVEARERLGSPLPAQTESALRRAAPDEPSHRYLEGAVHRRDVLASDLGALPSWSDRLRLLREHAFPPAAFIRERYGVKNPLLLPALYVHRLVTGAYKWVRP